MEIYHVTLINQISIILILFIIVSNALFQYFVVKNVTSAFKVKDYASVLVKFEKVSRLPLDRKVKSELSMMSISSLIQMRKFSGVKTICDKLKIEYIGKYILDKYVYSLDELYQLGEVELANSLFAKINDPKIGHNVFVVLAKALNFYYNEDEEMSRAILLNILNDTNNKKPDAIFNIKFYILLYNYLGQLTNDNEEAQLYLSKAKEYMNCL